MDLLAPEDQQIEREYSCFSICNCADAELEDIATFKRQIVVAVDSSKESQAAVTWALEHVYRSGDMFHLIHAIPEPETLHQWPGVYAPPDSNKETQEFMDAAELVHSHFVPQLEAAQVPFDAHIVITPDDPDSITAAIVQQAQRVNAALVVAAAQDKTSLQELWRGSVTQTLLRSCCKHPVCITRGLRPAAGDVTCVDAA